MTSTRAREILILDDEPIVGDRLKPPLEKCGYLVETLKEFRAGLRKDPMMAGVARGLSDADIANLAAHFAAQSCAAGAPARRAP